MQANEHFPGKARGFSKEMGAVMIGIVKMWLDSTLYRIENSTEKHSIKIHYQRAMDNNEEIVEEFCDASVINKRLNVLGCGPAHIQKGKLRWPGNNYGKGSDFL
eukprot:c22696_g1_i1 orf=1149-1460(+)